MSSATFHIQVKGLDEMNKAANKAGGDYPNLLRQAMIKSTTRIKSDVRANIINKGITNTGNLARSVFVKQADPDKGVVAVGEKYGGVVEQGRAPGKMPPVAPIERWAQTKLGAHGAGFAIALKIKREGTKAQPFVEPAFAGNIDFVQRQFDEANAILVRMLGD